MFTYIIGVLSGAAMPFQTSVNSSLRRKMTSPYLASLISFGGGVLAMSLFLLITGIGFQVPAGAAEQPIWIWSGGIYGIFLITVNILALKVLGSVETVIFCVLGQILSGLVIDHFGLFMTDLIRITPLRSLGAALVILGIVVATFDRSSLNKQHAETTLGKRMLFRCLAILAGVACGTQVAINGQLGIFLGTPFKATLVSLSGGTICAIILCLVLKLCGKLHEPGDGTKIKGHWWMYTGGLFGAFCVVANVLLANALGTGLAVIVSLIGQIAGGIIIDLTGFLGAEIKPITFKKIFGLTVMIIGAAIIRLL